MLNSPYGIFVDTSFTLYVADMNNNRIQKFMKGQTNGTTVAGNTSIPPVLLNKPTGVILDANGNLFITDSGNDRVIAHGPNGFYCVVGCSSRSDLRADRLHNPGSLSFDPYGNIYVADTDGNRIQKFLLATNSCGKCPSISHPLQERERILSLTRAFPDHTIDLIILNWHRESCLRGEEFILSVSYHLSIRE